MFNTLSIIIIVLLVVETIKKILNHEWVTVIALQNTTKLFVFNVLLNDTPKKEEYETSDACMCETSTRTSIELKLNAINQYSLHANSKMCKTLHKIVLSSIKSWTCQ